MTTQMFLRALKWQWDKSLKSSEKRTTKRLEQNKNDYKEFRDTKQPENQTAPQSEHQRNHHDPEQQLRLKPSTSAAHILFKSQNKDELFHWLHFLNTTLLFLQINLSFLIQDYLFPRLNVTFKMFVFCLYRCCCLMTLRKVSWKRAVEEISLRLSAKPLKRELFVCPLVLHAVSRWRSSTLALFSRRH